MNIFWEPLFSLPQGLRKCLTQSRIPEEHTLAWVGLARSQLNGGCLSLTVRKDLEFNLEVLVISHTHLQS